MVTYIASDTDTDVTACLLVLQDGAIEGQQGRLRLSYAKDRQTEVRGAVPQSSAASDALQVRMRLGTAPDMAWRSSGSSFMPAQTCI